MSPFEVDLGWTPKSVLDMLTDRKESVEALNGFKSILSESLADEKYSSKESEAHQRAQKGRLFIPQYFSVGDKLWINRSSVTSRRAGHSSSSS